MAGTVASMVTFGALALVALVGFALACAGFGLGYENEVMYDGAVKLDDGSYFSRWWAVVLNGVVVTAVGVIVFTGHIDKMRTIVMGFLVVACSVLMPGIHSALWSVEYVNKDKINAEYAAGGLFLMTLANFVGIIFLGVIGNSGSKPKQNWTARKITVVAICGVLALTGVGLMLGGTIPQQLECRDGDSDADCGYSLRLTWWTIAFELAVMTGLAVVVGLNQLEKFGVAISAFIALVTINLMDEAEGAVVALRSGDHMEELVAAGVLVLCVVNFAIILMMGIGAVMKVHMEAEEGVSRDPSTEWVSAAGVALLPLLLGLGMGVGGVARVHSLSCKDISVCKEHFQSTYWAMAFQLVVVAAIAATMIKKEMLREVRGFLVTFLVLASAETMRETGELLSMNQDDLKIVGSFNGKGSLGIAGAGFMVATAMNFVLILVLGCELCTDDQPEGYQPAP